jgi:hypothetical protein
LDHKKIGPKIWRPRHWEELKEVWGSVSAAAAADHPRSLARRFRKKRCPAEEKNPQQ